MEKERTDWNRWLLNCRADGHTQPDISHRAPLTWLTLSLIEVGTYGAGRFEGLQDRGKRLHRSRNENARQLRFSYGGRSNEFP